MGWDSPSALATFLAFKNTMAAFVGPVSPGYCPAAALLAQGWGKTLFSWACGDAGGGGELVSTLSLAVHVLLSVMRHFGWAHVPIVSSHQDIWLATARQVAMTQDTRAACGAGDLSGTRGAGGHGGPEAALQCGWPEK